VNRQLNPLIEPGIEPLVSAINSLDFARTVYSCEAHFDRPQDPRFLPTAYVTFGLAEFRRFIPLREELVLFDGAETETDLRLTYDCVLGRYTLSIWAKPRHHEPSQKREVIDSAVARLAEATLEFATRNSPGSSGQDSSESEGEHPCRERVPPCALAIPPKEFICPFG
jgi:hypothetical protein